MNIASASNTSSSWTDSVFYGWIDSTWDALLILEAARKGIVPRVTRRFHDLEKRNMIRSGAVIVFTEEESGIKRWTDPYVWSASRMLGNFMVCDNPSSTSQLVFEPLPCRFIGSERTRRMLDHFLRPIGRLCRSRKRAQNVWTLIWKDGYTGAGDEEKV